MKTVLDSWFHAVISEFQYPVYRPPSTFPSVKIGVDFYWGEGGGGLACTQARFQLNEHIDPLAHPFLCAARADVLCTYFFIPWFKYTDVIHVFIVSYMYLNYERIPL